jgi:transposase
MATEMFEKNSKVYYIQDNASYHKSEETWKWFKENRKWIEVHNLPPYCPELNAAEALWKYTRRSGTHNKYFETEEHLHETLVNILGTMYENPKTIEGYMAPFL